MKPKIDLEVGLEFSPQIFIISSKDQKDKLECCDIEPTLYGDFVDVAMLGLPTLQVLMDSGIPILGAVHLSQRFRQLRPLRLDETIRISGRIIEINPHPRGSIICCEFKYENEEDQICVEATRSGIIPLGAKEPSNSIFRPKEDLDGFNQISQKILEPSKVASFSKEAGNLIHSDAEVAKKHGFRAPIAAGLMGVHLYREVIARYMGNPECFDMEIWFRRPMFWDDTLSLLTKRKNENINAMHLLGGDGKPTSNCLIHSM
jgi:acyl dehydratase